MNSLALLPTSRNAERYYEIIKPIRKSNTNKFDIFNSVPETASCIVSEVPQAACTRMQISFLAKTNKHMI